MFQWCLLHEHPVFYGTAVGEGRVTSELWVLCNSDGPFLVHQGTTVTIRVPLLAPHTRATTRLGWLILSLLISPPSAIQILWVTVLPTGTKRRSKRCCSHCSEGWVTAHLGTGGIKKHKHKASDEPTMQYRYWILFLKNCYSFKLAYLQYKVRWSQRK